MVSIVFGPLPALAYLIVTPMAQGETGMIQMHDADALRNDWRRYAVVHWHTSGSPGDDTSRSHRQKRAFAELAEAVLFVTELDGEHRQMARIDCGGKTYHLADIERLVEQSDSTLLQGLSIN